MDKFDSEKLMALVNLSNSTGSMLNSISQTKENLKILKTTLELSKLQEVELPKIVEALTRIVAKIREVNDAQLSAGKSPVSSMAVRQTRAIQTSLNLEQDLMKDLLKYETDLIMTKSLEGQGFIESAIESLEKELRRQEEELTDAN
jgi:hypothetical protein